MSPDRSDTSLLHGFGIPRTDGLVYYREGMTDTQIESVITDFRRSYVRHPAAISASTSTAARLLFYV